MQAALAKADGRREKLVETGTLDLGAALAEAPVAPVSLVMHTAGELKLPLTTMDDDDFSDDEVTNGPVATARTTLSGLTGTPRVCFQDGAAAAAAAALKDVDSWLLPNRAPALPESPFDAAYGVLRQLQLPHLRCAAGLGPLFCAEYRLFIMCARRPGARRRPGGGGEGGGCGSAAGGGDGGAGDGSGQMRRRGRGHVPL